jgi:hypothetical protein
MVSRKRQSGDVLQQRLFSSVSPASFASIIPQTSQGSNSIRLSDARSTLPATNHSALKFT